MRSISRVALSAIAVRLPRLAATVEQYAAVPMVDGVDLPQHRALGALGPLSAQIVLVGDPGQIAPVVTGDARRWRDWSAGPQLPPPEALQAGGAVNHRDARPVRMGGVVHRPWQIRALDGSPRPCRSRPGARPYELSLRQLAAAEREAWGGRVAVELNNRFPTGTVLWFHAGTLYWDSIVPVVAHQVRAPLAGLGIARQLAWYRRQRT